MRTVIVLLFVGLVGVLAAQTTPPIPQPTVPSIPAPQVTPPSVPVPQTTPPAIQPPSVAVPGAPTPQMTGAHAFEGTWSASGQRQTLATDIGRRSATVQLSGAITVKTGAGLSRGFRGEVIGFDDGAGVIVGRVVWTDQSGDKIYSFLQGDTLAAEGRLVRGTITGGTGRYNGVTGEYEFRWQHVIAAEGNSVNGRAVDLRGVVRPVGSAQ